MEALRTFTAGLLGVLGGLVAGCSGTPLPSAPDSPSAGISLALADSRAQSISDVRYALSLDIPEDPSLPIMGRETVRFSLADTAHPVVLDFKPGADPVVSVTMHGRPIPVSVANGHIVIPEKYLRRGHNTFDIAFRAGDASLNRNQEFLYALFVPARAHEAFPCFDQPDLKARFTLQLKVPPGWVAVSNGAESSRVGADDGTVITYAATEPISTYLFTFAAGRFQVETAERNGRTFRMYHRETDAKKVERNRAELFDLHAKALAWLEDYTQIPYPFGKFDFILIPAFQFGGMEHPGAIFYNAAPMLLDESATERQMLNRAHTIAHETSHMWFGDLVTMRWFNDVWMKEVFANFIAAKIVNPSFPSVNHDLLFLMSNYPAAYSVDRTQGTHPIRQELENLNVAGNMYGAIIYQKAPIVMRQLERMLGPQNFQQGLRAYLRQFQFGNATWLDLVKILDDRTDRDIASWSRTWVEESGRPSIRTHIDGNNLTFVQSDPVPGRALLWMQQMDVLIGTPAGTETVPMELSDETTRAFAFSPTAKPTFVLPTGGGLAYGDFVLDDASRRYLLENLPKLGDPLSRGAAFITLWEELLERRVRPMDFIDLGVRALASESSEQVIQLITGQIDTAYWSFLEEPARLALAPDLERLYRAGWTRAPSASLKSTYVRAFRSIVRSREGVALLERLWRRDEAIAGLSLSEDDESMIALELAVRSVPHAAAILEDQRTRIQNPDRKAQFEFVMPALSGDPATRDAFFESLKEVKNRRREPWVAQGLGYLNHPLRAPGSEKYVRPALELLLQVQQTGDIFFPKNWMDTTLGGHGQRSPLKAVGIRCGLIGPAWQKCQINLTLDIGSR